MKQAILTVIIMWGVFLGLGMLLLIKILGDDD